MKSRLLLASTDKRLCSRICALLEKERYRIASLSSLHNIGDCFEDPASTVLIVDLDSLPVDDFWIWSFKKEYPSLHILGISARPFHPDLKEAMSFHIYACLGKPVDPEELLFWIASIDRNAARGEDDFVS